MSAKPANQLPRATTEGGCQSLVSVKFTLTDNDLKLKNRQLWKIGKKYWKADFHFVVKCGPADIKFQIVGKNGHPSKDHDSLLVEFQEPPGTPGTHGGSYRYG